MKAGDFVISITEGSAQQRHAEAVVENDGPTSRP
jgi:hypothetical protein